ncbi:MAG: Spy/CpxP family protein refolding chaperone [Granulosicoccaceae bacterium]
MKTLTQYFFQLFVLSTLLCLLGLSAAYAGHGMMEQRGHMMEEEDYPMMHGYGMGMMGYGYGEGPMMGMGRMGMMGYGGHPMMGMGHMGMPPMLWRLDLSDNQRDQVRQIMRDMQDKQWDLMDKLRDTSGEMDKLYSSPTPDPKKAGNAYAGMADVRRQMLENHIEAQNRLYQLLTEEQRKQLEEQRKYHWRYNR